VAEKTSTRTESPTGSTGTLTALFLGLLWLVTTMWTAHATIKGTGADASGVLGAAAAALPGVIAATLVTGASIGHAASGRFNGPLGACSPASGWASCSASPSPPASGSRTAPTRPL
jgi:hypothetical protein